MICSFPWLEHFSSMVINWTELDDNWIRIIWIELDCIELVYFLFKET